MYRSARALFTLALLAALVSLLSPASAADPGVASPAAAPVHGTEAERVIVRLASPPLAATPLAGRARGTGQVDSGVDAYLGDLARQQHEVAERIAAALPGMTVERSYRIAFNGLAIRLPAAPDDAALRTLQAVAGVAQVYREAAFQPTLYASAPAIGAPGLWGELGGRAGAGAGVRIAILDSGIAISHPIFASAGYSYPSGFPRGDGRFTTPKVIAARAYFRPSEPPLPGEETPVPGALGSGHGTHLAAIAGGGIVTASYRALSIPISGVAPRAWLMNYRIFYPADTSGVDLAYTAEILQAIEDAVSDGADVLCLGWSSMAAVSPLASAETVALQNAIAAGCIVVASAGNAGPGYGSAGRLPGGLEPVITVGAVSKGQEIAYDLVDVTGPDPVEGWLRQQPFARAYFGPSLDAPFGPFPFQNVAALDASGSDLGCAALPARSALGQVLLISRGDCNFADKAYSAQNAGAVAVLIANDSDELTPMSCGGERCQPGVVTIPTLMVTQSFGDGLRQWRLAHPEATLRLDPNGRVITRTASVLPDASGRGPAYGRYLKPDVVAPGVLVLSAYHDRSGLSAPYAQLSGASVATAHVAGAAALLRQAHPTWGQAQVKAALMGSARSTDFQQAPTQAGVLSRGAGAIDVAGAAHSRLLATPPSLSFMSVRAGASFTAALSLRSLSSTTIVYALSAQTSPSLSVSLPPTVSLAPGAEVTVSVRLAVAGLAAPGDLQADLYFRSSSAVVHVPLWAHVAAPPAAADVLIIDNDFSFFNAFADYAPFVTEALARAGYSYELWEADARYGQDQTIPDLASLQRFPVVLWFTGDNRLADGRYVLRTPLTASDMQILAAYLDGGGRLLAMGQHLAEASDVSANPDLTWGRADFYHSYLGAHWLSNNVFHLAGADLLPPEGKPSIVGLPGTFMAGVVLDLGLLGDGAGNQVSVDQVAPGGARDGADAGLVLAPLAAVVTSATSSGYVATAKADEPTLEGPMAPRCAYRSLYYAFGLEGVNDAQGTTTRAELMRLSMRWLLDAVSVSLEAGTVAPNDLTRITCRASSSVGAQISSYRWQVGSGPGARVIQSAEPAIGLSFEVPGRYALAVEATDALGHSAVARSEILVTEGGSSTLTADRFTVAVGEALAYAITARNTSTRTLSFGFTLPLPAGTVYLDHTGASYGAGRLSWTGSLGPGQERRAVLRVRPTKGAWRPEGITARAQFQVAGDTFTRTVRTDVVGRLYVPQLAVNSLD